MLPTPSAQTFESYAQRWLAARERRVRPVTATGYRACLTHAVAAFGGKPLAKVTRGDVEQVIGQLADAGRSRRTVALTLFVLRSIFADALHDGLIVRNPAEPVEAAGRDPVAREGLSPADSRELRAHLAGDRLFACWLLTLYGPRRSEVMGARWSDVDFAAKTLTVARGRVLVGGKTTMEGPPKTRRGERTLPLPADLLAALREAQLAEFGGEQVRTGYLAVDEIGRPVRPERWSDLWREHCRAAGVAPVTLHCARHTSVTTFERRAAAADRGQVARARPRGDEPGLRPPGRRPARDRRRDAGPGKGSRASARLYTDRAPDSGTGGTRNTRRGSYSSGCRSSGRSSASATPLAGHSAG